MVIEFIYCIRQLSPQKQCNNIKLLNIKRQYYYYKMKKQEHTNLQSAKEHLSIPLDKFLVNICSMNQRREESLIKSINGSYSFFISHSKKHTRSTIKNQSPSKSEPLAMQPDSQEHAHQKNAQEISFDMESNSQIHPFSQVNANMSVNSAQSFFSQPSQCAPFSFQSNMHGGSQQRVSGINSQDVNALIKMQLSMYSDINESQFVILDSDNFHIQESEYEYPHHKSEYSYEVPVGPNYQATIPKIMSLAQYQKRLSVKKRMEHIQMLKVYDGKLDEYFFKKEAIHIYRKFIEDIDSQRPHKTNSKEKNSEIGRYIQQNQSINGTIFYIDVNVMRNGYKLYTESASLRPEWEDANFWVYLEKRKQLNRKRKNKSKRNKEVSDEEDGKEEQDKSRCLKFREYLRIPLVEQFWRNYFVSIFKNKRKKKKNRFPYEILNQNT